MKIYLAPMEGVVDFVIRDLFSKIGGYDQMTTEFVRVTDKLNPPKVFYRFCPELHTAGKTTSGTPVFVQLLGGQPQPMAENAAQAKELGALGIDLNFGCPAKTVNRHDGGAKLLTHPHRLFDIITATKKAVNNEVPVTAKVRLGFEDKTLCNEIAKAVDEAGAHHLIVHARTKVEAYKPPAHWEYIAQMKEHCPNTRLIANGDIWTLDDYNRCREVSGCDDVALGRGAFANPYLAHAIKNSDSKLPDWNQYVDQHLPDFINGSLEFKSDHYAVTRTKQWTKFLSRNYEESAQVFESIKRTKTLEDLRPLI